MAQADSTIKNTVNLPHTDFPIRAGLATREPELLAYWAQIDLAGMLQKKQSTAAVSYMLHDGPPYPNGPIHMGHALNKILKDILIRFHGMRGERARYIPGWDCHGLPIETQVLKSQSKDDAKGPQKPTDIPAFRQACKDFSLSYVNIQRDGFRRLGVMGEWEKPYLTLDPEYEAEVIRLFGKMAENGVIYRGQKPIHWCTHCETALAEAEIEYAEHRSPSIYVTFLIQNASPSLANLLHGKPTAMLVWTTTPWTLPANVALAVHPDLTYALVQSGEGLWVVAEERISALEHELERELVRVGTVSGEDLLGTVAHHPFIDRHSPVVPADFVSAEDGTGIVHIAPGHGYDDYQVGIRHDLPVIMPVDAQGRFTSEVPSWEGQKVFDTNKPIVSQLDASGHLVKLRMIRHSYPHCWRCKNPVIFRATEQWFVSMDTPLAGQKETLREIALREIDRTEWIPKWGYNRIRSMVENRPDWCISRQRYWGIPIPAFRCKTCHTAHLT
ncbi:MAG: class I tRNA ligase family protein, partial [Candidatus Margulisiibacteriota bacterium]